MPGYIWSVLNHRGCRCYDQMYLDMPIHWLAAHVTRLYPTGTGHMIALADEQSVDRIMNIVRTKKYTPPSLMNAVISYYFRDE
jgi:hypothetical protein